MGDTYTRVPIHMTSATRNREPLIPTTLLPRVHAYIVGVLNELRCQPIAIGGVEDHVHILYDLSPERTMAEVARVVKLYARWDELEQNSDWPLMF